MSNEKKVEKGNKNFLSGLFRQQIFIPIAALIILAVFNLIVDPSFFKITLGYNSAGDPVLSGYLMTILDYGSELAILAIGMTLVTAASGGQDISVGATIAVAGSVVLRVLCGGEVSPAALHAPIIVAFLACVVVSMLLGAFNGALVAYFKIQPMVATLILFSAARAIGLLLCNNMIVYVREDSFKIFGGYLGFIPTPIVVAAVCIIITSLILKKTALGLYVQSVGINKKASRIAGIKSERIIFLCYIVCGLCAGIAGIVASSRISSADSNNIGLNFELDAILAVALGGNSLGGGKFRLTGSIIGAYTIQAITTTLYALGVSTEQAPVYKAVIVIIIVAIQAPPFKDYMKKMSAKRQLAKGGVA